MRRYRRGRSKAAPLHTSTRKQSTGRRDDRHSCLKPSPAGRSASAALRRASNQGSGPAHWPSVGLGLHESSLSAGTSREFLPARSRFPSRDGIVVKSVRSGPRPSPSRPLQRCGRSASLIARQRRVDCGCFGLRWPAWNLSLPRAHQLAWACAHRTRSDPPLGKRLSPGSRGGLISRRVSPLPLIDQDPVSLARLKLSSGTPHARR